MLIMVQAWTRETIDQNAHSAVGLIKLPACFTQYLTYANRLLKQRDLKIVFGHRLLFIFKLIVKRRKESVSNPLLRK